MADNEDESNMSTIKTDIDSSVVSQVQVVGQPTESETQIEPLNQFADQTVAAEEAGEPSAAVTVSPGETASAFLQESHDKQVDSDQIVTHIVGSSGIASGAEYTTISAADFALSPTTTIIYVQPDGTFVEGSGLTPELVEQLAKQELVTVSDTEAARLFEQNQVVKTIPASSQFMPSAALAPNELQQVIDQVTKSQQQSLFQQNPAAKPEIEEVQTTLDPTTGLFTPVTHTEVAVASTQPLVTVQNASQHLKNVAKQVALQSSNNGTRLIQKKPEPIRIQVQMPAKQEMTAVTISQPKPLTVTQPQVKVSANGGVSGPQIIHITPVVGQQQYFLQQNPGEPPIQLLLQSSTPVGSLVPLVHKLPGSPGTAPPLTIQTPGASQAAGKPPAKPPVSIALATVAKPTASASPSSKLAAVAEKEKEKPKAKTRVKKPLKVKTRSGRVSRPPKYKAKDYKFIKMEDLAESHQSDSDDYSEMSEEEEEDGRKGASSSMSYSHKQRDHKCKTCDKAYIGHGGLSRHYRLNPTHEDPPDQAEKTAKEGVDGGSRPVEVKESSPAEKLPEEKKEEEEEATTAATTVTTAQKAEPSLSQAAQGPAAAASHRGVQPRRPGRPRGRGRGRGRGQGRPRGPIPPKVVGLPARLGRRGRPPKLGGASVEQAQRRKDRLKEVLQQCDAEELMEVVLPRMAKAVTLWDLLLMKVEKGRPAKAQFPEVYREFELLHGQVKKMAQEYISNPQGVHTALEVHNMEVAKSIGIFDEVNKLKIVNPGASQSSTSLAGKTVRYMENSKMLPPSKRFKMENSASIHQNGLEKTDSTAESSLVKGPSGTVSGASGGLKACSVSVSPLVASAEGSKPLTAITADVLKPPAPLAVPPPAPPTERPQPQQSGEEEQEEAMDTSSPGQEDVLSTSDIAEQMKELEKALATNPVSAQPLQPAPAQPLTSPKVAPQPQASVNLPTQQASLQPKASTQPKSQPQASPQPKTSTQPKSQPQASTQPKGQPQASPQPKGQPQASPQPKGQPQASVNPPTQQVSPKPQAAPKPQATPQPPPASQPQATPQASVNPPPQQAALPAPAVVQEGEEIYIQTEGLTMQVAEGAADSDRIVIVKGPDGTTMTICAPEGVPLEAVTALLGIEAEGRTAPAPAPAPAPQQ